MSSYVAPLSSGSPPQAPTPLPAPAGTQAQAAVGTTKPAVAVSTIPSTPPPEVTTAMGVASQAFHNLKSQQKELQFVRDQRTGRVVAEIRDAKGNVIARVPSGKVLDLASGSNYDE